MTETDWHTDAFPELRSAPPWVMQEMIAAQPRVVRALLSDPPPGTQRAADAIRQALAQRLPVTVCGCGTSEHAAHALAAILAAAVDPGQAHLIRARPSLGAALEPAAGVCVAVSHDGGTHATALALQAARGAGATTVTITHEPQGSVAAAAEHVLLTPEHDDSWCHTLAYTSALAAGAALAGSAGSLAADPGAAATLLEGCVALAPATALAQRLAERRVLLCAGAAADHITARELALKIAEGARLPTVALELETVLHGQLAGHEPADALILVLVTQHRQQQRIARRAVHVARAAAAIGLPVAALVSEDYAGVLDEELTPAGQLLLPGAQPVHPLLAGLLAGAGALQALTLELAHARHTNPDLIRREQAPYRQAAQEGEGDSGW